MLEGRDTVTAWRGVWPVSTMSITTGVHSRRSVKGLQKMSRSALASTKGTFAHTLHFALWYKFICQSICLYTAVYQLWTVRYKSYPLCGLSALSAELIGKILRT